MYSVNRLVTGGAALHFDTIDFFLIVVLIGEAGDKPLIATIPIYSIACFRNNGV